MICAICSEEKDSCKSYLEFKSFMKPIYNRFTDDEMDDNKFIYCDECLKWFKEAIEKQKEKK